MSEKPHEVTAFDDIINGDVTKQIRNNEDSLKSEYYLEEALDRNAESIYAEYVRKLKNENEELELTLKLKKGYARNIFLFMCIWTVISFVIIFLDSLTRTAQSKCVSFDVSDSVMITLIGGTTVSVIGLVGFVVKGLFPSAKTDADTGANKKK